MAGLGPAIHVFIKGEIQDVDARHKAGHDGSNGERRTHPKAHGMLTNPRNRARKLLTGAPEIL
jgi:hypothetical protein